MGIKNKTADWKNRRLKSRRLAGPPVCEKGDFENVSEFCEKWEFENMNFVKNETLKMWILWKVRFSKWEFLDQLRIFAPVWSDSILCCPRFPSYHISYHWYYELKQILLLTDLLDGYVWQPLVSRNLMCVSKETAGT